MRLQALRTLLDLMGGAGAIRSVAKPASRHVTGDRGDSRS